MDAWHVWIFLLWHCLCVFKAKQLHQEDPIDSAVVGEDDDNNLNESLPGLDEICQELLLEDGCVKLSFFYLFF